MRYITTIFLLLLFCSCEDVIDVDLNNEEPRLIVDALIRIDTSQEFTNANIKISLSSSFFGDIEPVSMIQDMQMQKLEPDGFVPYEPVPGEPGMFRPFSANGAPVSDNMIQTEWLTDPSDEVILFVTYNDKRYIAFATFAPSVYLTMIPQK